MGQRAQIWVETVIYTLIGLAIIATILALITPKVQETKDSAVIDQSIEILDQLSTDIEEIKLVPGNSWPVQLKFERGRFVIDGKADEIYYILENSKSKYSEPGLAIQRGKLKIITTVENKNTQVWIGLNYSGTLNLTYEGSDRTRIMQPASLPYDLYMENMGKSALEQFTRVNFKSG